MPLFGSNSLSTGGPRSRALRLYCRCSRENSTRYDRTWEIVRLFQTRGGTPSDFPPSIATDVPVTI